MTTEQEYVDALQYERAGYARAGREDRVAEVDAELARLGHEPIEGRTAPRPETTSTTPAGTQGQAPPSGGATSRGRGSAKKAAEEAAKQEAAQEEAAAAVAAEEAARLAPAATAEQGPAPAGPQAANGPQNAAGDAGPGDPATGQEA